MTFPGRWLTCAGWRGWLCPRTPQGIVEAIGEADHIVLTLVDGHGDEPAGTPSSGLVSEKTPVGADADGVSVHHGGGAHVADDGGVAAGSRGDGMVDATAGAGVGGDDSELHGAEQQPGPAEAGDSAGELRFRWSRCGSGRLGTRCSSFRRR